MNIRYYLKVLIFSAAFMFAIIGVYKIIYQSMYEPEYVAVISKSGSSGEEVFRIQERLYHLGLYGGKISGFYDLKTTEAVMRFQIYSGLRATGVCGIDTLEALRIENGMSAEEIKEYSDLRLLAHAVDAEAGDEPYLVKVSLAAVILNRLVNPTFPDTIAGIIFEMGAFEKAARADYGGEPSLTAWRATRDASYGFAPIGGAVYMFDVNTNDKYFLSLTGTAEFCGYKFALAD